MRANFAIMRRTYRTLNDCEMQHNAEVGLSTNSNSSRFHNRLFLKVISGYSAAKRHNLAFYETVKNLACRFSKPIAALSQ